MTFAAGAAFDYECLSRRPSKRNPTQGVFGVVILAATISAGAWALAARPFSDPEGGFRAAPAQAPHPARTANAVPLPRVPQTFDFSVRIDTARLSSNYTASLMASSIARNTPLDPEFRAADAEVVASAEPDPAPIIKAPATLIQTAVPDVPLPTPRPRDLDQAVPTPPSSRAPVRQLRGPTTVAAAPGTPTDGRSVIEKLFGIGAPSPGPELAYASPETSSVARSGNQRMVPSPGVSYDNQTAIYDIAAHTVYLPDGSSLEAHSGLGSLLDDPDHVSVRDRGATPPHLYDLSPREQLFHGVKALRLNPVGGGGVFGRAGLLAHTFMLGPNGQSNGCVSFRNYEAFLRAYENGSIRRLAVVARR